MGMDISEGIQVLLHQAISEYQSTSITNGYKTPKGLEKVIQEIKDGKSESFESIDELVASWK